LTNQKAQKEEKKPTESKSFILERGVVLSALAIIGKGKKNSSLFIVYLESTQSSTINGLTSQKQRSQLFGIQTFLKTKSGYLFGW
jgi:hypothetical protein